MKRLKHASNDIYDVLFDGNHDPDRVFSMISDAYQNSNKEFLNKAKNFMESNQSETGKLIKDYYRVSNGDTGIAILDTISFYCDVDITPGMVTTLNEEEAMDLLYMSFAVYAHATLPNVTAKYLLDKLDIWKKIIWEYPMMTLRSLPYVDKERFINVLLSFTKEEYEQLKNDFEEELDDEYKKIVKLYYEDIYSEETLTELLQQNKLSETFRQAWLLPSTDKDKLYESLITNIDVDQIEIVLAEINDSLEFEFGNLFDDLLKRLEDDGLYFDLDENRFIRDD